MQQPRHSRIFSLAGLCAYPGSDCLDLTFWLPPAEKPVPEERSTASTRAPVIFPPGHGALRRVWLMAPRSTPIIAIDDTALTPRRVADGKPRWVDYGTAEVPTGFTQLRLRGLEVSECSESHLVVSADLELVLDGCTLEDAERRLWGLSRAEAGRTALWPPSLTVGSAGDFTVTYTAGAGGLPARALVRFAVPHAFNRPQVEDPKASGFVSIGRAQRPVQIAAIEDPSESHAMTDIICRLEQGLRPGEGFDLRYHTDTTFVFPCVCREADRRYWYSKLAPLAAAAAMSEQSPFVSLLECNSHSFSFPPGPAETLHLFLPGRRVATDDLTLTGLFTDRCQNNPEWEALDANFELWLVIGENRLALGTPAGHFTAHHRFEVPLPPLAPGVYRALATRADTGEVLARSNPLEIMAANDPRGPLYWGEIHGHTEMSDGVGDYWEMYRHARQDGRLDFAAGADHACYFSDNQWQVMQDITNFWDEPGRFVTLNGYEWAGKQVHRNIYTSRRRLDLFRGMYAPTSNVGVVWEHFHGDQEIVGGPHAPLRHGIVWEQHDPEVERFVEVYSTWGASDVRDGPLVPEVARQNPRGMSANELLQTGAKLGFTGGGDCHEGRVGFCPAAAGPLREQRYGYSGYRTHHCGMTAAVMPRLDRESLIAALRERRTYATSGPRTLLEFSVSGLSMGSIGTVETAECQAEVHSVAPLRGIEIIKDGEVVYSRETDKLDVSITWRDPAAPAGEHYYYLRVTQADGEMAWSSPVWVQSLRGHH